LQAEHEISESTHTYSEKTHLHTVQTHPFRGSIPKGQPDLFC
jgi:hypothetical protein